MKKSEILELLRLRGWSRARLAAELDLTQNAVDRWLFGDRNPSGPAAILMRNWLEESRADESYILAQVEKWTELLEAKRAKEPEPVA